MSAQNHLETLGKMGVAPEIAPLLGTSSQTALLKGQEEAQRFNHNYIGTEHILLGLMRLSDIEEGKPRDPAHHALTSMGVELNKVRSAVEFIIGKGDRRVSVEEVLLTPKARKVIEFAVDEERTLRPEMIGLGLSTGLVESDHLLLGLLREGEGIGAGVLESLGVHLLKTRARVLDPVIRVTEQRRAEQEKNLKSIDIAGFTLGQAVETTMRMSDLNWDQRLAFAAEVEEVIGKYTPEKQAQQ